MRTSLLLTAAAILATGTTVRANDAIDRLWDDEGKTLQQLLDVSFEQERGEVLLRLGLWQRDSANRLEERSGDDALITKYRDEADETLSQSLQQVTSERLPIALFSLGDLRRSRGQYDAAEAPLAQLVEEFPDAPLALDAAIALGDDAFEQARLADAVARYEFVIERAVPGDAAAWARYKLAWCRINLGEHGEARRLFRQVASRGSGGSLVDEAQRDFVIALARDASVDSAHALAEIESLVSDPARRRRYGQGWADLVGAEGRDEEAADTYAQLVPGAPVEEAARMLAASLNIAVRRRDRPVVIATGRQLADIFEARPDLEKETAERALRVAALTFHGEGRAAGDTEKLLEAYSLYEDYFRGFPDDPHAYELHHHAGELLLTQKQPALSERHYTAAVLDDLKRIDAGRAPGQWLASSAHGAVVAAQQLVESAQKDAPSDAPATRDRRPAEPLHPDEEVLVAACDRYLKVLPTGDFSIEVAFQRGLLFYRRHWLEDALGQLSRIALEHSDVELAPTAAEASLDALRQLAQWDELAAFAKELSARPALSAVHGKHFLDVRQGALLAAAEQRAKSGHHDEAARRYLEIVDEFPDGEEVNTALYNAAASLAVSGRTTDAVKVRATLIGSKTAGDLLRRALEQQVDDLLRLGRFADAQSATLALSEKLTGDKRAARLHDAAIFADAAGDAKQALFLREKYLREHRKGADVFAHALELAERTKGCIPSMSAFRRAASLAPDSADRAIALSRTARAEARCNEDWWAQKHADEAVALRKRVPATRLDALDALADAELLRTETALAKYRRLTVRMPFQTTIPRKLEALKSADSELAKVVALGRPEAAVCALTASGQAWASFASTLSSVRAPPSFTEEQRMMFEEELASRAQPLSDRALATLREARKKAREAGLWPACLSNGLEVLSQLAPEEFAPRLESVPTLADEWKPSPGDPSEVLSAAPDAPAAWLVAAHRELARRRPQAALLLLERLDTNDPLAPAASHARFEALRMLGQNAAAHAFLVQLSKSNDSAWIQALLADSALAARDYVAARGALGRLLRTRDDAGTRVALAVSARALGATAFAIDSLNQAIAMDDGRADAHLALGVILCAEGNAPADGIKSLERFDALHGHAPDAAGLSAVRAACAALAKETR